MSGTDMFGTPPEGGIRRKPSYSEVLRATPTRPAPINTDVTRSVPSRAQDTATTSSTATSGFWSADQSLNTGYTVTTPLFAPSIWSPVHPGTQSATIPRKSSWETTINGKINEMIAAKSASPHGVSGLGVQMGESNDANGNPNKVSPTRAMVESGYSNFTSSSSSYKYQQQDIAHAQTQPYSQERGLKLSKTAPLTQKPFSDPDSTSSFKASVDYSSNESKIASGQATAAVETSNTLHCVNKLLAPECMVLYITPSEGGSDGEGFTMPGLPLESSDASASDASCTSEISENAESKERDARMQAPMIAEEPHPHNFIRTLMDGNVPFSTAFDGADAVCTATNPSHYAMEYGSRAICMKTDFVENIHWAIKNGKWGVMEKVAARIMELWNARSGNKDKVLLIFSVNGQKSYCGLAEMSGPWEKTEGGVIDGYKVKRDGQSRVWGTMPITWIFIKNVSYYWFSDIDNPTSGQAIANMWNGMHYPSDIAREVIERIIKRPHFTNILAWRQDQSYDPFRPVLEASQIDPLAGPSKRKTAQLMIENGRKTTRPLMIENGRQAEHSPPSDHGEGDGIRPKKTSPLNVSEWRRRQKSSQNSEDSVKRPDTSSTPPNLDGNSSPRPRHGKVVMCTLDDDGNYVPITPHGLAAKTPVASSTDSLIDMDTPRGPTSSLESKVKVYKPPARGVIPSFRSGRGNASARGTFRGANNAEGASRVTSTPPVVHKQQSLAGLVGPQIRRMKSDIGLDDPFGTPRTASQGDAVPRVIRKNESAPPPSKIRNSTLQHTVNTASIVPKVATVSGSTVISTTQPTYTTDPYANDVSTDHVGGLSGGVMLEPPTMNSPMSITPTRVSVQGAADMDFAKRDFTPTGHQIYPSPTDPSFVKSPTEHATEKKSDNGKMGIGSINAEYAKYLRRQQAIDAEIMSLRFQQAGMGVPEHLKTMIATGGPRD